MDMLWCLMFTRDGMIWFCFVLQCWFCHLNWKWIASSLFAELTAPDKFPIMHHKEKWNKATLNAHKKWITRENKKIVCERKLEIDRNLLQNHIVHCSSEMFQCSSPLKQHHTLLKFLIPLTFFFPIGGWGGGHEAKHSCDIWQLKDEFQDISFQRPIQLSLINQVMASELTLESKRPELVFRSFFRSAMCALKNNPPPSVCLVSRGAGQGIDAPLQPSLCDLLSSQILPHCRRFSKGH